MSDEPHLRVEKLEGEALAERIKSVQSTRFVGLGPGSDVRLLQHVNKPLWITLEGVLIESVAELPDVKELSTLEITKSPLRSLDGIERYGRLGTVNVPETLVTDLRPLLSLPELLWVDVRGCPLDRHSYEEVLPELIRRAEVASRVTYSSREDWEITREMYDRGWAFTYYRHTPESAGRLRYPEGPPVEPEPAVRFRHVSLRDLRRLLDEPGMTKEGLWERLATLYRERSNVIAAALQRAIDRAAKRREEARAAWRAWAAAHLEVGWGREVAGRWKDESPSAPWGRRLDLVLGRFPDVPWERVDEAHVQRIEKNNGCASSKLPRLPAWYRDALKACSGPALWPEDAPPPPGLRVGDEGDDDLAPLATVRFGDAFLSDWIRDSPEDYYLNPGARMRPAEVETVAKWGLFPIGDNVENVLAIALHDPSDKHIYVFSMATLYEDPWDEDDDWDEDDGGDENTSGELELPPVDGVTPVRHPEAFEVFEDWAEMWSRVVSITYDPVTFQRVPLKELSPDLRRLHRKLRG